MAVDTKHLAHKHTDVALEQFLDNHLFNVARTARQAAAVIRQGDVLFLLGLYHDLGKADGAFQDKLCHHPNRHVDHSYAGALYLKAELQRILKGQAGTPTEQRTFIELICYVISAHHGVYDIPLPGHVENARDFGFNKLVQRLLEGEKNYNFERDVKPFAKELEKSLPQEGYASLDDLVTKAFENYRSGLSALSPQDETESAFYASCFMRLYLSLLKNADILDTINAYKMVVEPLSQQEEEKLKTDYCSAIESLYTSFGQPKTELNRIRTQIAERVKARAMADSTGIYRLDLPTGAGKTNLGMRYAFHQMTSQQKRRFFYMTPFLSVLEQNASAIRKVVGDLGVLEHHSNVLLENKETLEPDSQAELQQEYLLETWDSPIVLTTMVQFFQTLFKTKSAHLRRFSSLMNSVLMLDEVQSLPLEVTTLFNLMMTFLSRVMGATVVLCTATQPVYDSDVLTHSLVYGGQMAEQADLVDLTQEERQAFTRTELRKYKEDNQEISLVQLAQLVLEESASTLVILNTKPAVAKLYDLLQDQTDLPLYQLTTNMCAQHRLDKIGEIKDRLKGDKPLICISTQLIEAGVDVDFERVIRSYAGIDSIVQAAGRCNREGKRPHEPVTLVNLSQEEENLSHLKSIKAKKEVTKQILDQEASPIDPILLNREFFERYYTGVKNSPKELDYPLTANESVYDYLSLNTFKRGGTKGMLRQSFKTAGQQMNLINEDTVGIIVRYGQGEVLIDRLVDLLETDYPIGSDLLEIKSLLKQLQPYTLNVREGTPLLQATTAYWDGRVRVLNDFYYDGDKGAIEEVGAFLY